MPGTALSSAVIALQNEAVDVKRVNEDAAELHVHVSTDGVHGDKVRSLETSTDKMPVNSVDIT